MSGNVDKKLLAAYAALKKRADAGDPSAKADLAKLAADPKAVMQIRAASARTKQRTQNNIAGLVALTQVQGDSEEEVDEYVPGTDDIEDADRAHRQLPPGSGDLEHKAALRHNRAAVLNQQAPFSNTNPPDVVNGMQGNAAIVQPGQLIQVCNYQGDDAHCAPLTLSVFPVQQLHIEDAGSNGVGPIDVPTFRPFARIRFGCKGAAAEALIDIGTGFQLTVAGSMTTIEVGLHDDVSGTPLNQFDLQYQSMKLAGMISAFKPIVRTAPLTYTVYADAIAGAGTTFYYIPPFAKSVLFVKNGVSIATDVHLVVSSLSVNDPNAQYEIDIPANAQQTVPLLLSGNASFVSATNAGGTADITGQFIFELDI